MVCPGKGCRRKAARIAGFPWSIPWHNPEDPIVFLGRAQGGKPQLPVEPRLGKWGRQNRACGSKSPGLCGNSYGSLVAPVVASRKDQFGPGRRHLCEEPVIVETPERRDQFDEGCNRGQSVQAGGVVGGSFQRTCKRRRRLRQHPGAAVGGMAGNGLLGFGIELRPSPNGRALPTREVVQAQRNRGRS